MGILNYAATISLDGYIADHAGDFQWAAPDEEVFAFHLERLSDTRAEILGRRTYTLMQYWEDDANLEQMSSDEQEFAKRWRDTNKFVVSSTMASSRMKSNRTRLLRELSLADIRRVVAATSGVVEIFGPTTAAEAIRACLIDRFEIFVVPIMLGGGRKAFPEGSYRTLKLERSKTFANGTVYLRYVR
jgi:dihydrofolate reductase